MEDLYRADKFTEIYNDKVHCKELHKTGVEIKVLVGRALDANLCLTVPNINYYKNLLEIANIKKLCAAVIRQEILNI